MEVRGNYDAPTRTKVAVIAGTALATGAYIRGLIKGKGTGNVLKRVSNLELGIKEGIELCTVSTLGGLLAGLAVDKPETRKYKYKDSVNQLVGNTFIPFGFLALANKITKPLPKIWQTIIGIGTLITTTFLGHNVANKINEKIFKEDSGYKCTLKDFICDTDDFVFAASTVMNNKALYQFTASVCPITYAVHGFLAGCRQKENKKLDKIV